MRAGLILFEVGEAVGIAIEVGIGGILSIQAISVFPGIGHAIAVKVRRAGLEAWSRSARDKVGGIIGKARVRNAVEGETGAIGRIRPGNAIGVADPFDQVIGRFVRPTQFDVVGIVGKFSVIGANDRLTGLNIV